MMLPGQRDAVSCAGTVGARAAAFTARLRGWSKDGPSSDAWLGFAWFAGLKPQISGQIHLQQTSDTVE